MARTNVIEKGIEDLKKELGIQREMLQQVLDFWNEHKDTPSNQGSVQLEKKTGFPQVSFTRVSDNSIHLGQGIYLPKNSYLTAAVRSKTPSQFVRKMIMAVLSPKELQDCSVHGAKSNKVKPVESNESSSDDSSDIEENTIVSAGEESHGESSDEETISYGSNHESDNAVVQESNEKFEGTDFQDGVMSEVAASNQAEEKLTDEQEEKENEVYNSSKQIQDQETNL